MVASPDAEQADSTCDNPGFTREEYDARTLMVAATSRLSQEDANPDSSETSDAGCEKDARIERQRQTERANSRLINSTPVYQDPDAHVEVEGRSRC